ncbi:MULTISPECIES: hypothetical protein [unclassified Helicobacter]|uniref:hypothetical protein n=1 Tax=unclassified Helicobacter TaxID=2593540 RepID=UPI000CF0E655|nr:MULTISPECIES: hypothetical protein [unclassified Helicobacter]
MRLLLVFLFSVCVYSKSFVISPLPLPRQEVLDINIQECDEKCLNALYEDKKLFSFVAKFNPTIRNQDLRAKLTETLTSLDLFMKEDFFENIQDVKKIKIALLIPREIIGRYSATGINTILAYLTSRNASFSFEVFDSRNEEAQNLHQTYEEIKQKKFDCTIALLTKDGVLNLLEDTTITIPTYIPTVNRLQIGEFKASQKIFFGGIDYQKQIQMLYELAGQDEVVEYDDSSSIGSWLQTLSDQKGFNVVFRDVITNEKAARFMEEIARHKNYIKNRAILLNIPVIRTGLILPQIGFLEEKPTKFLSTQINYNPSLLMLLKPKDRKNFFIINAIGKTDPYLIEYGLLLGSDFQYDWVSYSIGIGIEMFLLNRGEKISKFFSESIEESQVEYTNKIYKTYKNSFIEVK